MARITNTQRIASLEAQLAEQSAQLADQSAKMEQMLALLAGTPPTPPASPAKPKAKSTTRAKSKAKSTSRAKKPAKTRKPACETLAAFRELKKTRGNEFAKAVRRECCKQLGMSPYTSMKEVKEIAGKTFGFLYENAITEVCKVDWDA